MWFQKNKSSPPKPQPTPTSTTPSTTPLSIPPLSVQQLELRLRKLEEELAGLTAKRPEIRIDTLHIHQPVLENLTFRLDQLDIKELSGSLNLGNNFGAKPNEKQGRIDDALEQAKVSKGNSPNAANASRANSSSSNAKAGTSSSTGDGAEDAASTAATAPYPERTPTGYRFTPQSKT